MIVHFSCPKCERTGQVDFTRDDASVTCPNCELQMTLPSGAFDQGQLRRCVVCPSADLFVRKDFPQRLGVVIAVLSLAASCVAWYYYRIYIAFGILFGMALLDALLFFLCNNALQCYRCGAIYRDVDGLELHPSFDLEVHERYRQQAAREKEFAEDGPR